MGHRNLRPRLPSWQRGSVRGLRGGMGSSLQHRRGVLPGQIAPQTSRVVQGEFRSPHFLSRLWNVVYGYQEWHKQMCARLQSRSICGLRRHHHGLMGSTLQYRRHLLPTNPRMGQQQSLPLHKHGHAAAGKQPMVCRSRHSEMRPRLRERSVVRRVHGNVGDTPP